MIIDDGPFPQGYYDMAGEWHFYDPERAYNDGRLRLDGLGDCVGCQGSSLRSLRGRSGLGLLGEPGDTILLGVGTAAVVGGLVYLLMKRRKGKR